MRMQPRSSTRSTNLHMKSTLRTTNKRVGTPSACQPLSEAFTANSTSLAPSARSHCKPGADTSQHPCSTRPRPNHVLRVRRKSGDFGSRIARQLLTSSGLNSRHVPPVTLCGWLHSVQIAMTKRGHCPRHSHCNPHRTLRVHATSMPPVSRNPARTILCSQNGRFPHRCRCTSSGQSTDSLAQGQKIASAGSTHLRDRPPSRRHEPHCSTAPYVPSTDQGSPLHSCVPRRCTSLHMVPHGRTSVPALHGKIPSWEKMHLNKGYGHSRHPLTQKNQHILSEINSCTVRSEAGTSLNQLEGSHHGKT